MADIDGYIHNLTLIKGLFNQTDYVISRETEAALKIAPTDQKKKISDLKNDIKKTKFGKTLINKTQKRFEYSMIIIVLFMMIIGTLSYFLYLSNNSAKSNSFSDSDRKTYKTTNWPTTATNHAFSIRMIDLNNPNLNSIDEEICLQPVLEPSLDLSTNNFLILQKGCDDDNLRFIARPEGQLQKFKPKTDKSNKEYCLKPVNNDKKLSSDLIYTNTCNDNVGEPEFKSLRFTYESDGKIKHTKSDRCIHARITPLGGEKVILDDCETATKFKLI